MISIKKKHQQRKFSTLIEAFKEDSSDREAFKRQNKITLNLRSLTPLEDTTVLNKSSTISFALSPIA